MEEVITLREELKATSKGYNELTKLGIRLTKEIRELKTRARNYDKKTEAKLSAIA
jgi:hypothetical protein